MMCGTKLPRCWCAVGLVWLLTLVVVGGCQKAERQQEELPEAQVENQREDESEGQGEVPAREAIPELIPIGTFLVDYPITSDGLSIVSGGLSSEPVNYRRFPPDVAAHFPGRNHSVRPTTTPDEREVVTSSASDMVAGQYVAGERQIGAERPRENPNPVESFLRRTDPQGAVLWTRYHSLHFSSMGFMSMTLVVSDAAGDAYITSHARQAGETAKGVWAAKYGRNGNVLWDRRFGHHRWCAPKGLAVSDDGVLIVFVEQTFQAGPTPAWLLRIDAATGEELSYTPVPFEMPAFAYMAMAPNGEVWLALDQRTEPDDRPIDYLNDRNAINLYRFDRENRLVQKESVQTPLRDRPIDFRIDSDGNMWLLARAAQEYVMESDLCRDMPPRVAQEYYYWVSLEPTIRSNWSSDD